MKSQASVQTRPTNGKEATDVHPLADAHDTEVLVRAQRRMFSAEYKRRILAAADQCDEPGQIGALLRREGLYSSHLSKWRQQRQKGTLDVKRGRTPSTAASKEVVRLWHENDQLRHRLEQAETIIAVQKNFAPAWVSQQRTPEGRQQMIAEARQLAETVGVSRAARSSMCPGC